MTGVGWFSIQAFYCLTFRLADLAMLEGHLDDDLDPAAKAKIAAAENRIHLADDLNSQARLF